jgi:hypothetical protein
MIVDLYLVYSFIRRLATPFSEWEAFKLGIIDEKGNILKKRKDLLTIRERDAFGVFDRLVLRLKKLLEKLPGGQTRIASYAAALWLIKEWNHFSPDSLLTEDVSDDLILESIDSFIGHYRHYTRLVENVKEKRDLDEIFSKRFDEDAPTVNVGSGAVAGLGIGDDGEPGLTPRQMRRHRSRSTRKSLRDVIGAKL